MRVKIQAGAEFDVATKDEVRDVFKAWMDEISRGVRFRRASSAGVVVGGNYVCDGVGPDPGFVWSVTLVAVGGEGINPAADTFGLNLNDVSAVTSLGTGYARVAHFNIGEMVLNPNDALIVSGAATGAGARVVVSLLVAELPVQLAYQFL